MLKRGFIVFTAAILISPLHAYSFQDIKIDASVRFRPAVLIKTEQDLNGITLSAWFPDELLPQIQFCKEKLCRTYIPQRKDLPNLLVLDEQSRSISVHVSYF